MGPTESLHDAARAYAARGWCIIPIRHKPNTPGKQPAVKWTEFQSRHPTKAELCGWFASGKPVDGLAVILGPASGGLVCRDFDTLPAYERWAATHPDLARTLPTVRTARGRHVYFRSDWSDFIDFGDGELRGDAKHYTLLPPSVHPDGTRYEWVIPWPDLPPAPVAPRTVGFLGEAERTEPTERTEKTEETEDTEIPSNDRPSIHGSALSALSVSQPEAATTDEAVEEAIQATQPEAPGQRNRQIFELARALKAIPALSDADVRDLRGIVRRWHERALPIIGTKPFDDTWADFVAGWPRVHFPRGQEPMTRILARARAADPPRAAEAYDAPETRLLVTICRELQRIAGDGPFFLACRTAAHLTALDQATAWRRLGMLVHDRVLSVIEKGTRHRATRYRYVAGE